MRSDNSKIFKKEYLSKWIPNKGYDEAYKLWVEYFYKTELFDSLVCTGSNEYENYLPANEIEHIKSYQNAIRQRNLLYEKRKYIVGSGIKITDEDWQSAKHQASKYKLDRLQQEYEYYFTK